MPTTPLVPQQQAFMLDMARLIFKINELGFGCTGKELLRTAEMQALYLERGMSKTANSYHLKGLAIDIYVFDKQGRIISQKELLQPIGDYWESLYHLNSWGGNWKSFYDAPHFERRLPK